jgi:hypothetical protein
MTWAELLENRRMDSGDPGAFDGTDAAELLVTHPAVGREIWAAVAGGEPTPTSKAKRSVVTERFDELFEEMYAR